jgi:hypothetical protein
MGRSGIPARVRSPVDKGPNRARSNRDRERAVPDDSDGPRDRVGTDGHAGDPPDRPDSRQDGESAFAPDGADVPDASGSADDGRDGDSATAPSEDGGADASDGEGSRGGERGGSGDGSGDGERRGSDGVPGLDQSPAGGGSPEGSLDVIRAEFDQRRAEQERRGDAFDTRAGLVIGFVGVLIGLSVDDPSLLQIIAQFLAVGAALAAGRSLVPRLGSGIGPRALYSKYATRQPAETRKALLETRIWLYEQDEKRLVWKVSRLKWAAVLLVGSVVLMLFSSIVEYASPTDEPHPNEPTRCALGRTHHEFVPHCPGRPGRDTGPPGHRFDRQP